MLLRSALLIVALSPFASGCGPSCEDACENVQRICAEDFKAADLTFDVARCTESCEENVGGCADKDAQVACVAGAKACGDLQSCTCP
ncbi:MAG: hypothetical protein ACK4N5_03345 [Myxococcales bacterium]